MAFYYVKSGGTATGDGGRYTSQKTGAWSSAFSAGNKGLDNGDTLNVTVTCTAASA